MRRALVLIVVVLITAGARLLLSEGIHSVAPDFTFDATVCPVDFTDASCCDVTSWLWDFGDGNTSTNQNPSHQYAQLGQYTVCLTVTTATDAASTCQVVQVGNVGLSADTGVCPTAFTGSTDCLCSTSLVLWDFGDGNTSTQTSPVHQYPSPGDYTVCLTAVGTIGTDSSCQTVHIANLNALPSVDTGVCPTAFSGSADVVCPGTSWLWDFGDGDTSTSQTTTHAYPVESTYDVCLTAVGSNGVDSTCQSVTNTGCVAYDAAVTAVTRPSAYAEVPGHQMQALDLGAEVRNNGGNTLTGLELAVTVEQSGGVIHTDLASLGTVGTGVTSTVPFASFVPGSNGPTTITYAASHDGSDGLPGNDAMTVTGFVVTDQWLSRSDGTAAGILSVGAGASGELGTTFEVTTPVSLTAVRAQLQAPMAGEPITARVRALDGANHEPGTLIATSDPFTPTAAAPTEAILPFATGSVLLFPGSYYAGLTETTANALSLVYSDEVFTPGTQWVDDPVNGWESVESFAGVDVALSLRVSLDPLPAGLIFSDGFESGSTVQWSALP